MSPGEETRDEEEEKEDKKEKEGETSCRTTGKGGPHSWRRAGITQITAGRAPVCVRAQHAAKMAAAKMAAVARRRHDASSQHIGHLLLLQPDIARHRGADDTPLYGDSL
ncbi:hypothetical protein EYF80_026578 [Liparis tanakae]|uniref:Uncharacterized protein n=1 Tax=Liparis tanakae TaxID=230148 RepID=A0A4Z2HDA0_9TELE|nr:hypothetical protein EYF80_026578 [Liparis tanakae]